MEPILETIAKEILASDGENLDSLRIILPNRRAALFLHQHLLRHQERVSWSPLILTIDDFITRTSLLDRADPVRCIFALYDQYCGQTSDPDTLDEFYLRGETMIRDFDELDKYLVDPDLLFRNIRDLKELEEPLAGLEPDQVQFIRQFWGGFLQGGGSGEKQRFLSFWNKLPGLYHGLKQELESEGEGYTGMIYREIADRIEQGILEYEWQGKTLVAGFNALNACEKRIFRWLQAHGAQFYWDYDHEYMEDEIQEAGRFIRENLREFPPPQDLDAFRGLSMQKEIRIHELPSDVLQAKTVHRILNEIPRDDLSPGTQTAVVLCDEELLMPVIMSLPEGVADVNVTMGYPLKNTPLFNLVDSLFRMQHHIRTEKDGSLLFYHREVISILSHPYLNLDPGNDYGNILAEMAGENLYWVEERRLSGSLAGMLFRKVRDAGDLLDYLKKITLQLLERLSRGRGTLRPELERETLFQMIILLNQLETKVREREGITGLLVERLLLKMLSVLRIPFEGEPLSGIQIMGILETRLLDFRNVILLSMNEEVMPASTAGSSFIPYALRLAFQMPSREDKDAIFAYYFHRLLQRADRVDLLYNSTGEGVRTGEMSRYLYQLMFEKGIGITRTTMEIRDQEIHGIEISQTESITRKLMKFATSGEDGRILSPTAINTWLDCSLKFYLRYVAGIGESDRIKEELDASGFGTVVHEAIKEIYSRIANHPDPVITRKAITTALRSDLAEEELKNAFTRHHFKGRKKGTLEGRNILIFSVMLNYMKKVMIRDRTRTPFRLIAAEQSYEKLLEIRVNGKTVPIRIGGKIDRVDQKGEVFRVIDYKTGEVNTRFPSMEALFDPLMSSRNSAALQVLIYAWLTQGKHEGKIQPGIYGMKALYDDGFDPLLTMGSRSGQQILEDFSDHASEFMESLKPAVERIFDPSVPFRQTTVESRCATCDFAELCNRASMD